MTCSRFASTLRSSPHVYVLDHPINPQSKIFSLLSTTPPTVELALGETEVVPPEQDPSAFRENPRFLHILHSVLAEQACQDPQVKAQAAAMISSSGASFMQVNRRTNTGSSGASDQGGYGSAGRGGFIHVSDNRRPPDYGRIADPEDIFGSLEVEGDGSFTNGTGKYQESGTYRIVTRDGVLGLPDYLRQRLVERLRIEEAAVKNK
ncbi:hypothetical protein LTS08_001622 [Lithohypha guttulata]|nr:hypothetical protein LTS08_001622 [Lithohypha guttulata]